MLSYGRTEWLVLLAVLVACGLTSGLVALLLPAHSGSGGALAILAPIVVIYLGFRVWLYRRAHRDHEASS
jgi:hypothetical protein